MAKKTTTKENPQKGRCIDCKNAYLMRSEPHNPIVARCELTQERWVASMEPGCGCFCRRVGEIVINEMEYLNRH